MLDADRDTLTAFAMERGRLDPTFAPFVGWCESNDLDVAIVSDGFAFYIEPMMRAAGLGHVTVISNEQAWRDDRPDGLRFVNAHPSCIGCGTCKMQAVLRYQERGPVAFVGEGQTDRYGALYADVTFAKLELVALLRGRRRAVRRLGGLRRRAPCRSRLPPICPVPVRRYSAPDGRRRNASARSRRSERSRSMTSTTSSTLANACELHDVGYPMWERGDLTSDFVCPTWTSRWTRSGSGRTGG